MNIRIKVKMKKKVLALFGVLVLAITITTQTTVLADNEATQSATTNKATSILIRNVADNADVATITFPAGTPSGTVENPTGNSDVQVLTATGAEAAPVAILTSTTAYDLWYNVTDATNWTDAVASERIYTQAIDASLTKTDFETNAYNMTVWGTDQDSTNQSLAANVDKELFLQVTLSASGGKSGSSTFSVLGETP